MSFDESPGEWRPVCAIPRVNVGTRRDERFDDRAFVRHFAPTHRKLNNSQEQWCVKVSARGVYMRSRR
jgi:hypothetical protein